MDGCHGPTALAVGVPQPCQRVGTRHTPAASRAHEDRRPSRDRTRAVQGSASPPRARGMAAREPLAGVVAPMEVHMAVRTPVATHAISAHRPPVMRPAGSHGAGRPKSARTRWPLSLSGVFSPAHGGRGSSARSRTSPPSCTEPACAARKSPGSMSAPVAEMHREDARDSKRWNLTQRVDGAGGMGYDRGMVEDAGQAGRADRRPARRPPHGGGDGERGCDGDGAWDTGAARMPLGIGHPPVGPRRVGRPPCRRGHRSRQGLPRVTGADFTPSTLRSLQPS